MKRQLTKPRSRYDYEQYFIDDLYNAYLTHEGKEYFDEFVDLCYDKYCESLEDSQVDDNEDYFLGKFS